MGRGESVRGSAYMSVAVVCGARVCGVGRGKKVEMEKKKGKKAGREIKSGDCLFV